MALFYVIPVQSPFLLEQIGVEKESLLGLGLILATIFAALAARLHPAIKRRISFASIYVLTFGLIASGYGLIALTSTLWTVLVGTIIAGFGAGLLMPNGNLWLIQVTNPAKRGKVIGGMTTAVFLGQFFSPVLLQPVINSYSIFIAHAVAATFALLMVGVYIVATFRQSPAKSRQKVAS
jgi:MFS family permease